MRFLFYLGHPAHFHLFRNAIAGLRQRGHSVEIVIKTKDILQRLLEDRGWSYHNILAGGRGDGKLRVAWGLLRRDRALFDIARRFWPDVMAGTSAEITHVGRMLRIPSVVVNEDDHDVVPVWAALAYPFADCIVAPVSCRVGRWRPKTVFYEGYHELAYLHPNHFTPDPAIRRQLSPDGKPYYILRLAKLTAYHDDGRRGLHDRIVERLIALLDSTGRVYISAERTLAPAFERYRIPVRPLQMHDALAFAGLYIGDSQTMAAEAAVLGTPSIRFNDFVGEIGYLQDLEERYGLTKGIPTSRPDDLIETVRRMLSASREELAQRRQRMLSERIDVARFLEWFLEQYPNSVEATRSSPAMLTRFGSAPNDRLIPM